MMKSNMHPVAPLLIFSRDMVRNNMIAPARDFNEKIKSLLAARAKRCAGIVPRNCSRIVKARRSAMGEYTSGVAGGEREAASLSLLHDDSYSGELQNKLVEKYSSECREHSLLRRGESEYGCHRGTGTVSREARNIRVHITMGNRDGSSPPHKIFPRSLKNSPTRRAGPPMVPFYAKRYFASVKRERRTPTPTRLRLPPYRTQAVQMIRPPISPLSVTANIAELALQVRDARRHTKNLSLNYS